MTTDGRVLNGEIDAQSDAQTMWIRYRDSGIILTTAVPWTEIISTRLDGKEIAKMELASQVSHLGSNGPEGFLTEYEVLAQESQIIERVVPEYGLLPRVASLEIGARLANLDRTVEPDGIVLAVSPLDAHGRIVPVCGNVSVRLLGELFDQHTGRVSFLELESWNSRIADSMFADGVAGVSLRFRQIRPEFDLALCTTALVNVRLGIPGTGNFEASVPVDLRTLNPFREQLQYYEGSRFFSNELTHNTRQLGFRPFSRGLTTTFRNW
ncbi:hypothetical protein [Bythopirellula polymerisocia]|nr:hypothetical protein [Bythopirellula polymerisocia]